MSLLRGTRLPVPYSISVTGVFNPLFKLSSQQLGELEWAEKEAVAGCSVCFRAAAALDSWLLSYLLSSEGDSSQRVSENLPNLPHKFPVRLSRRGSNLAPSLLGRDLHTAHLLPRVLRE